ncbi:MAG: hypothetical protein H7837_06920 [Magnetococcus sp. MYC-9]
MFLASQHEIELRLFASAGDAKSLNSLAQIVVTQGHGVGSLDPESPQNVTLKLSLMHPICQGGE